MNLTLYVQEQDRQLINRARRLIEFHLGKSLSQAFLEMCEQVVQKYDKGTQNDSPRRKA